MICPRWVGNIDGLVAWEETLEESSTNTKSTGTRDGLGDNDSALLQWCRISAIGELEGSLCESGNTGDACILLVQCCVDNFLLGLLYGGKDVRLALVITICANACDR